jgi:hypothetical protein
MAILVFGMDTQIEGSESSPFSKETWGLVYDIKSTTVQWLLSKKKLQYIDRRTGHYWKTEICRVFYILPSVKTRTLGNNMICRVLEWKHTAKTSHSATANKHARQTYHFAEC